MSKIAIFTDSTCNIPDDMAAQHGIYVVPEHVIWGTEDLLDLKDITPRQFYERLVKDPVHPKTSQPPASEFGEAVERAKKEGAKEIMIVTISSVLSGTYASALQAAEEAGMPVRVLDSRSAAMGLGWQVIAAARARDKDADIEAMIEAARRVRRHLAVVLTVDTLEYLHRGGRIGGAAKLIGTALNLKPQLILDPETGTVEPGERTRTRSKAIEAIYQVFFKKMDASKPLHIGVHHASAAEDAQALVDRIKAEHANAELIMNELTPVLGTHTGPGTLGLAGYYEA